jgi:ketosteroid isomerase-like protein
MAGEAVDLVRRLFDAFERRDDGAMMELWHPRAEVELHLGPEIGHYRGRDGVRQAFATFLGRWDDYELQIEDMIEQDGRVVVLLDETGKGKGSGVAVRWRSTQVYEVRDGQVTSFTVYPNRDVLPELGLEPR